jgi:hypothetical protein
MHPEEFSVLERMTIHFTDQHPRRRSPQMGKEAGRSDIMGQVMKVPVVPGRGNTGKNTRLMIDFPRIPTHAKAITIQGFAALPRVVALCD